MITREGAIALCVYTCKNDFILHNEFYASPVIAFLKNIDGLDVFEVTANPSITATALEGNQLVIKTDESYVNLPLKTYKMICHLSEHLNYDFIVKIDVTTLTRAISNNSLTGGKVITNSELISLFSDPDYYRDYNGFVQLNARRRGAENWAANKGISIEYDKVFKGDTLPPFYSGKTWLIGKEFANFIANEGMTTVELFSRYFPAEDVMLGFLYQRYISLEK